MKLGTSIRSIEEVDSEGFQVSLEYTDGFKGTVNLGFLFSAQAAKPMVAEILRGSLFSRCYVESGALAWPNGYELCPDSIRAWIEKAVHQAA